MVVQIRVEPNGCCVVVSHAKKEGYAVLSRGPKKTGQNRIYLHRFLYEAAHGTLPQDVVIRHTCDNRACVNPAHLITGTHADNVADRVSRGRSAAGEQNGRAKLSAEQVREIRRLDGSHASLSKRFGVDSKVIRLIRSGKIWRGV